MVGAGSRARRPLLALAVAVGIALAAAPTLAHHSRAMFDMGKNITYRGVVEEYRWQNPHSHIVITVGTDANDPSTVGTWDIEASSINIMISQGWNRMTYKPGDPITVVAHPMKKGSKGICCSIQSSQTARGCIALNIGMLQKHNSATKRPRRVIATWQSGLASDCDRLG